MFKNIIRRWPGFILFVLLCQIFLSVFFLTVIYYSEKTVNVLRTSGEMRSQAVFQSDMTELRNLAENPDLSDERKRMLLYQKAHSASDALAETGWPESARRAVTDALSELSGHLLEGRMPDEKETAFLRLFGENDPETAFRKYTALENNEDKPETEDSSHLWLYGYDRKEALEKANALFGVSGVLSEAESPGKRTFLFTCRNAYAVLNSAVLCPLEADIYLPPDSESAEPGTACTAEECRKAAERFVSDVYPKKIYRSLAVTEEIEYDDRVEVNFSDRSNRYVSVTVSKQNGRMVSLRTSGLEDLW